MTDYKILYKFATRSRPKKMHECVMDISAYSKSPSYKIHLTLDADDYDTLNSDELGEVLSLDNVEMIIGESTGKVNAINRDMNRIRYPWDIVVVWSDDMKILKKNFDVYIREAFDKFGLDSVIHFHDGPYGERLMGLNIQGRLNYERFGYLYNPEYISLWCDNEQKSVAEIIGNYHWMGNAIKWVSHIHPSHIKGLEMDDLLRKTESYYKIDEKTYNERKARNFDL